MENKKEKVQILADKLNGILPLIDSFMDSLNDEDKLKNLNDQIVLSTQVLKDQKAIY